jgi:N-acetylglucosaminyldiphosphoundecaprenol N-acetyl-beta-D-mannosaminyltransferase
MAPIGPPVPTEAMTTPGRKRERFGVLGVWIDAVDPGGAQAAIEGWIGSGEGGYVCVANVHSVMEARRDPALQTVFNAARLAVPDGMPLVWVGRLRGHRGVRRVYGPDLTLQLCERAAQRGHRCFFYGGAPGVAEQLAEALGRRFPGLRVAGTEAPAFRPPTPEEDEEAVRRINAAAPDLIFVGLGCPKQERWMAAHRDRLRAAVLVGVGAAFDFHTGRVPQAPRWMMRAGFEWLFRLGQEPRRLWRRYLVYNPLFVFHLTLELLGLRRYPLPGDDGAGPA